MSRLPPAPPVVPAPGVPEVSEVPADSAVRRPRAAARPDGERGDAPAALAIGGSAGAIDALLRLLPALPAAWRAPVLVVVHLPRGRPSALAEVLKARLPRPVEEALDKQPLAPGTVHVAPPDYHLLVEPGPALALSVDAPVNYSIPSIDVLFESAAEVFGPRLAAVVLSGASEDGARGLAAVAARGGLAFVQAPAEAPSATMPAAALAACPQARALPVAAIAAELSRLVIPRAEA